MTKALARLAGDGKVSEAAYRDALNKHRPALQETYRGYFRDRGVAAMVFPTTPLPAAKIGEDDTLLLNGSPAPTFGTFIRNLTPGSAAGLPGLALPAGMTGAFSGEVDTGSPQKMRPLKKPSAGLPVGIAIDGPQ